MHNIAHFELPSTNLEISKAFYQALFGWKIEKFSDNYYLLLLSDTDSGGLFSVETIQSSQIAIYFETDDIPATLVKAVELGGKELEAKRSIGDHGFIGAFSDPCGLRIDLWSKS